MGEGGSRPDWPAEGAAGCRLAGELLQASQYEQVAAILHTTQANSAQAGDAILAHMLDAAGRVCMALLACHAEAERHRQAFQETEHREQELRQELYAILELLGQVEMPRGLPAPERQPRLAVPLPAEPAERGGLWRRIQDLLRHRTPAPSSGLEQVERPPVAAAEPRAEATQLPISGVRLPQAQSPAPPLTPESAPPLKSQGERTGPTLVVYCLGPFRVYQGDQLINDWNGLKGKSIFKYLLAHRDSPVAKDILMDLFWPDADPESARRSLHQAIYSLRQTLRRGGGDFAHVHFENDCYLLNPRMSIWVDSIEFEGHIQAGKRLEAADHITEAIAQYGIAESLYQGDYLEEDLYEDWPAAEREHLRRMYCDLADGLSEYYYGNGEYNAAIALCHKVLARDNCHEPAHRRLMRCYLAQGQRHLAVRQYQTCVEVLQQELELGPSEETEILYQRIIHTT